MIGDPVHLNVQGTFDIAKGRNLLRKLINDYRWSLTFGAHASAVLTAVGEMILQNQQTQVEPARLTLTPLAEGANGCEPALEISLRMRQPPPNSAAFVTARERLGSLVSTMEEAAQGDDLLFVVRLNPRDIA